MVKFDFQNKSHTIKLGQLYIYKMVFVIVLHSAKRLKSISILVIKKSFNLILLRYIFF